MSSIELKIGSCFRGQNKHSLFFTKHLQKEAGDKVCLDTATKRFKRGKKKKKHALTQKALRSFIFCSAGMGANKHTHTHF